MKTLGISFDLGESRDYGVFFRRLHCMGAFPIMKSQWAMQTPYTVEQIERDLREHIDPADRLLVTCVGAMTSRNLINTHRFRIALR